MGKKTSNNKTIKNRSLLETIFNVILIICAVITLAVSGVVIFQKTYYEKFYVNGQSMYPFLNAEAKDQNGNLYGVAGGDISSLDTKAYDIDYGILDSHKSAINSIKRFDVVVWNVSQNKNNPNYYIKRVIGLPGETIKFDEAGQLYLKGSNDEFNLIEQPIDPQYLYDTYKTNEIVLDNDEYYLCGDNRAHSTDCRLLNRNAKKSEIVGKAVAIIGKCTLSRNNSNQLVVSSTKLTFWPRFL